jgi:hypothetical protein
MRADRSAMFGLLLAMASLAWTVGLLVIVWNMMIYGFTVRAFVLLIAEFFLMALLVRRVQKVRA